MVSPTQPAEIPVYHITSIGNLENIFTCGCIYSKNSLPTKTNPISIAESEIQDRRNNTHVPEKPGGVLNDYVPFYFGARSPMLLKRKSVQENIVYLVSSFQTIVSNQLPYVFTDGHGIMAFTSFYNTPADLTSLDWNTIHAKFWPNTNDDPDRKRRKQAEFLVYQSFPVRLIERIGVYNQSKQLEVQNILNRMNSKMIVQVQTAWYY
jgi:hypothetical protein